MNQQHEPRAVARLRVFQHLFVAVRVAECSDRTPSDYEMDSFGLTGLVVIEEQLGLLGEDRFAVLVVAELHCTRAADHLLGRYAVSRSEYTRTKS